MHYENNPYITPANQGHPPSPPARSSSISPLPNGQGYNPNQPLPLPAPFSQPTAIHDRHNLFFSGPVRQNTAPAPTSPREHHHPYHAQSLPHNPYLGLPPVHVPPSAAPPGQESPTDQRELELALELSKSETSKQSDQLKEMHTREEEELALALEASMKSTGNSYVSGKVHPYSAAAGSSTGVADTIPEEASSSSQKPDPPIISKWTSTLPSQMSEDEALARQLAEEDEAEEQRRSNPQVSDGVPSLDDEALARKFAEEEEEEVRRQNETSAGKQPAAPPPDDSALVPPPPPPPVPPKPSGKAREMESEIEPPTEDLPTYSPQAHGASSSSTAKPSQRPSSISSAYFSGQGKRPKSSGSGKSSMASKSMSSPPPPADPQDLPPLYDDDPPGGVSMTNSPGDSYFGADLLRNNSTGSGVSNSAAGPLRSDSVRTSSTRQSATTDSSGRPMSSVMAQEPMPSPGGNSQIQFLDPDLLAGVSLGFQLPSITDDLGPLSGTIPNVVSLPYGKCPPLHLKAPNWRQLLRLLARLSGSRLEPSVEAHASTKDTTYRLRTVVQFIKSHPMSQLWQTVLWFTIDHPVPPSMPGASKYTPNEVNILPFSYTLSTIPALLRDSDDSNISQTYTIPSTENTPYPALPISFPNLAMYLQAVLDESRRYMDDSSSGIRKLGRMMETCYPSLDTGHYPDPDAKRSMGGFLKRLKGGKTAKKGGRGGNEETYELVTPFFLDQDV